MLQRIQTLARWRMLQVVLALMSGMIMALVSEGSVSVDSRFPGTTGAEVYHQTCSQCHGVHGEGRFGLGTALNASSWLKTCQDEQLIALVMDGVHGRIPGSDTPYPVMVAMRDWLSDYQLAEVCNYVARAWIGRAAEIRLAMVQIHRERYADRLTPWALGELARWTGDSLPTADQNLGGRLP
ncbi:MAG: cytochrome c [Verrucomicrobiaceae bacterium]|nr:cytochrome c [Verrucomicrobiaceae bacterium]